MRSRGVCVVVYILRVGDEYKISENMGRGSSML